MYNALEQRVMKSGPLVPTGAAYFVYDEEGHVLGEYNASGQPIYEVIWLGDQPVASVSQVRTRSGATLAVQTRVGYSTPAWGLRCATLRMTLVRKRPTRNCPNCSWR